MSSSQPLNRSIYVPISFRACEHIHEAVLYVDDQAIGYLPVDRTFLFTYYPSLKRIEPETTQVRVEGRRQDGSHFKALLAVTMDGIYSAKEKIEFDQKELRKLRYKVDVRYERKNLRLRCDTVCARLPVSAEGDDAVELQAKKSVEAEAEEAETSTETALDPKQREY